MGAIAPKAVATAAELCKVGVQFEGQKSTSRNTVDENEPLVDAKAGEVRGTQATAISGNNVGDYRRRVKRL